MRRKIYVLMAAALTLAASCVQERYPSMKEGDEPLSFSAVLENPTKGPVMGTVFPISRTVTLSAQKTTGEDAQVWFTDIPFAWDGSAWSATPEKKWPHQGSLAFLAWSADGLSATATHPADVSSAVTLVVPDNSTAQCDVLFGGVDSREPGAFTMTMRHAMSLVTFSARADEAYDAATNTGVTMTGVRLVNAYNSGTVTATRSASDVSVAWSALGSRKNVLAPAFAAVRLTETALSLGEGLLVPPQNATRIVVEYTIHGGFDSEGSPVNCPLEYEYRAGGAWQSGWRYNYEFSVTSNDIAVRATLEEWRMTGNFFYGTADHVDHVGNNFDFSAVTDWMWRATADDAYQRLTYETGTWGDDVSFSQGGWAVNVAKDGDNLVLSYFDVARNTPLTMDILTSGTFSSTIPGLEWSLDGTTWTAYDGAEMAVSQGSKLRLRASGGFTDCRIDCDGNYSIGGNVMSLLSKDAFADLVDLPAEAFERLFVNQAHLVSATSLLLPGGTIGTAGMRSMFRGCVSLTATPDLAFIEAGSYACDSMFYGCKRLRKATGLQAETLGKYAYRMMFISCVSLTDIPALLPATAVPDYGYYHMFYGCTALEEAPELAMETVGSYGCSYMFYNCTALRKGPSVLKPTTLTNACYYYMFYYCSKMTDGPGLPATTLASSCYSQMFYGCKALNECPVTIPMPGGPTTAPTDCCYAMYRACTSLDHVPELPCPTVSAEAYMYMFYGCTSITAAPDLPCAVPGNKAYLNMFNGCSRLSSARLGATDISAYQCLQDWLTGVAATGTLYAPAGLSLPAGASGLPSGWTLVEE